MPTIKPVLPNRQGYWGQDKNNKTTKTPNPIHGHIIEKI